MSTKERILVMIITLTLMIGCSIGMPLAFGNALDEKAEPNVQSEFGTFVILEQGRINASIYQYILYDPQTMVMYSYLEGVKNGGPTVMYNADGTLKIYSPKC